MRRKRFPGEYIGRSQLSQAQRAREGRSNLWAKGASSYGKSNSGGLSYPDPWGDWANYPLVAWPQPTPGSNQPPGNQGESLNANLPQQVTYENGYFMNPSEQQEEEILNQPTTFRPAVPLDTQSFIENKRTKNEAPADAEFPPRGEEKNTHSNMGLGAESQTGEDPGDLGHDNKPDQEDEAKLQATEGAENVRLPQQTTGVGRIDIAGSEAYGDKIGAHQEPVAELEMDGKGEENISSVPLTGEKDYAAEDREAPVQTKPEDGTILAVADKDSQIPRSSATRENIIVWKNFPK